MTGLIESGHLLRLSGKAVMSQNPAFPPAVGDQLLPFRPGNGNGCSHQKQSLTRTGAEPHQRPTPAPAIVHERLDLRLAAVHEQFDAVDVGGLV